jgi:hypothetical protein
MKQNTMRKLITTTAVLISLLTSAQSLPPALDTLGLDGAVIRTFTTSDGSEYIMLMKSEVGIDNCEKVCRVVEKTADNGLEVVFITEDEKRYRFKYKELGYTGLVSIHKDLLYGWNVRVVSTTLNK